MRAASLLKEGELVAIPTETVYGLAANAYDEDAVLKIFSVKERPSFDPLIVHIGTADQIHQVVGHVPDEAWKLAERFWPGPLTLVLPKRQVIPDVVTSGLDSVAVRMPDHVLTLSLLRQLPFPLAAPSANPFGYISPTMAQHVQDQLGAKIPYILDGGPCEVGLESTIIGWDPQALHWTLYRHGGIPVEQLRDIIGQMRIATGGPAVAPGMLASHYAPRKPLHIGDVEALLAAHVGKRIGVISFTRAYPAADRSEVLAPGGDLALAAKHLFRVLRGLDVSDVEVILAEVFPDEGLGRAINDRLRRASS